MSNLKRKALEDFAEYILKIARTESDDLSLSEFSDFRTRANKIAEYSQSFFDILPVETMTKILDYAGHFKVTSRVCNQWNEIVKKIPKKLTADSHISKMMCWSFIRFMEEVIVSDVKFELSIPTLTNKHHLELWMHTEMRDSKTVVIFSLEGKACERYKIRKEAREFFSKFSWKRIPRKDTFLWETDITGALDAMPLIRKYRAGCLKRTQVLVNEKIVEEQKPDHLFFYFIKKQACEKTLFRSDYGKENDEGLTMQLTMRKLKDVGCRLNLLEDVDFTREKLWSHISKMI